MSDIPPERLFSDVPSTADPMPDRAPAPAVAALDALERLSKYATHDPACVKGGWKPTTADETWCTCGLDRALADYRLARGVTVAAPLGAAPPSEAAIDAAMRSLYPQPKWTALKRVQVRDALLAAQAAEQVRDPLERTFVSGQPIPSNPYAVDSGPVLPEGDRELSDAQVDRFMLALCDSIAARVGEAPIIGYTPDEVRAGLRAGRTEQP